MQDQKSEFSQPQDRPLEPKPDVQPHPEEINIKKPGGLPPFIIIGLVILGVVAAAVLYAYFSKTLTQKKALKAPAGASKKTSPAVKPPVTVVEVTPVPTASKADQKSEQDVVEDKPIPSFSLSGILFGQEGSIALINGRIVHEGAEVEGAKVTRILSDRVELEFQGQKITLRSK
ncbi:MAG TPA: type II secretion system protein N [Candidatus Omnitrophota bacterium]|nr:type II secretion system protein N [Candidatus Omnitrophota bacterium]